MRKLFFCTTVLLLILVSTSSFAGNNPIKFAEISTKDFETKLYPIDSNANAVIVSDVGSSKYEGDTKGGFNIIFKRHTRIRILNRNGFDVATFSIPLYASGSLEEKIDNLEANTYNLENGEVHATKLDKNSIFKDRISKYYTVRKFTMPDLREGCIIELKYTFISPYEHDLRGWQFQAGYPTLWSEYSVEVPSIYDFVFVQQGYHPYAVNTSETTVANYNILSPGQTAYESSTLINLRTKVVKTKWAMENVPAMKPENFTTNIENHVSKIEFQLSKIRYPDQPVKNVLNNWTDVAKELLEHPDFGQNLFRNNGWMDDDIKKISAGTEDRLALAKKIFEYVRDNFTCNSHSNKYLSNPLKKTFQSKTGNVADINLLLTAMLIQQAFDAHPAVLGTRDHGKVYELYPVMDQLNYVLCAVMIDGKQYLLDASYNKLGFGNLPTDCYNGYARLIDKYPVLVQLNPDSLRETTVTNIFIINDEKEGLTGSYTSILGQQHSFDLRQSISKSNTSDFFKEMKKGFSEEVNLNDPKIDSLNLLDDPIAVKYDFSFKPEEDIVYINPMFGEAIKDNPFKALNRTYPVEMPYLKNETFVLNMQIPKGYAVEEMPKSTRVKLNEDEGMFEYIIGKGDGVIQMRSTVKLNKATFLPEDYQTLRDFYAYIVKKHSEQIVFKKIK